MQVGPVIPLSIIRQLRYDSAPAPEVFASGDYITMTVPPTPGTALPC